MQPEDRLLQLSRLQEINETPSDDNNEWAWRVKMPGHGVFLPPKVKAKEERIYTLVEEADEKLADCNCIKADKCSLCMGKIKDACTTDSY
jgi:hypothetical protein